MADDRKKVSSEQLLILIEEIEKDSSLSNGRVTAEARELYNEKWEQLAKRLNSVDNGALKNIAKWQQAWRDWKSNTKKKASRYKERPGDSSSQPLTPLEQRVLEMSEAEPAEENGIDISNIEEADQSSSSDSETDDSDEESGDSDSNPASSDAITLYSERESSVKKRSHSADESQVSSKRRRHQDATLESISRQNRRILTRLAQLEQSQLDFQKRHAELLAGILASLERQLTMEERLSSALNRIANFVDDNAGPGG